MERAIEVLTVRLVVARADLATYAAEDMTAVPPADEVAVPIRIHRARLLDCLETISALEQAIVALGGYVPSPYLARARGEGGSETS